MLEQLKVLDFLSSLEPDPLRLEAMDLFERCLTEGRLDHFQGFIDRQLSHEPPEIDLLRDVAEDLHQRLISLRETHFDVREHLLRTLRKDFSLDISPIVPPNALESYHLLEADVALNFLRQQNPGLTFQETVLLRKLLANALEIGAQIHTDVLLTEQLYFYLIDWIDAISVAFARHFWSDDPPQGYQATIH